ncbi:MAG: hypothetical protein ACOYXT_18950, partial [Bacteroidota bacterium]
RPDGVVSCVSFDKIYETTKALLSHRVPLLIEKPAGTSLWELNDLIQTQQQYGTKVQVAFNRRHYSVIHKAIADMGGIDQLNMFSVEWSENPVKAKDTKNYTRDQLEKLIFGNSIHGLDALAWYTGGVENFHVQTKKSTSFLGWNMALSGTSKRGVLINFLSSWDSPVPWRIVMYGGGKRYEFAPLETCRVFDAAGQRELTPATVDQTFKAGFYQQAKRFLELIEGKSSGNDFDLSSGVGAMTMAEALYRDLMFK